MAGDIVTAVPTDVEHRISKATGNPLNMAATAAYLGQHTNVAIILTPLAKLSSCLPCPSIKC